MLDWLLHLESLYLLYFLIFLISFLENLIFTGWLFPGTWLIILISFLANTYHISLYYVFFLAFFGNLLGTIVSYYIGLKVGKKALNKGFLFIKKENFQKAKELYNKNYILSLVLGKLIPGIKESIGFIAGIFQLDFRKFIFFSLLGIFLWSCIIIFIGFGFSSSIYLAEKWFNRIGIIFAIIFVFLALLAVFRFYLLKFGKIFLNLLNGFLKFVLLKLGIRLDVKLLLKSNKYFFITLLIVFSLAYLLLAYLGFFQFLYNFPVVSYTDRSLEVLFYYLRYEFLVYVMIVISFFGKLSTIIILALIFSFYFIKNKDSKFVFPLWLGIFFVSFLVFLTKIIVGRTRPDIMAYIESGFSFPSFHSAIAIFFYLYLAYYFSLKENSWKAKVDIITLSIFFVILIGFSRLYLGVHYLSDVLGGYFLGFFVFILSLGQLNFSKNPEIKFNNISKLIFYILFIILIGNLFFYINNLEFSYRQVRQDVVKTNELLNIFNKIPNLKYTTTLFGRKTEPINFIILSKSDKELENLFLKAGFSPADKLSLKNIAKLGASAYDKITYLSAPMTPLFWNKNIQMFGFQKQEKNLKQRHHIRIWKTNFKYNGYNIYVASAVYDKEIKWGLTHKIDADIDKEREYFFRQLLNTNLIKKYKKIQFVKPIKNGKNFSYDRFFTDGKVYIIYIDK